MLSLAIPHQEKRSPQYPAPSPFFLNTVASAYRNPNNNRDEPAREGEIYMEVTVRVATVEDAERVSDFAARSFSETFAADNTPEDMAMYLEGTFTPERLRCELGDPGQIVLLLEAGAAVIAYAHLTWTPAAKGVTGEAPVELARFYVDRAWHGRGVAQRLMRHVLDAAARDGAGTLWLGVWERNPRAIAFYRKHGFVDVGSHSFVLGRDVQTDRIMQRPVTLSPGE